MAGKEALHTILDFACGHGRVLRMLAAAFPAARLTACDLDPDGVEFCARTFGATGVVSREEPAEIELEGPFDLIWCGSLLTHVDEDRWHGFLSLWESLLAPDGVLVFTTHGRRSAENIRSSIAAQMSAMLGDYDRTGFGYEDYPDSDNYGTSLSSPAWVCRQLERVPGLRLLMLKEEGWADHQDVVACLRAPAP